MGGGRLGGGGERWQVVMGEGGWWWLEIQMGGTDIQAVARAGLGPWHVRVRTLHHADNKYHHLTRPLVWAGQPMWIGT